MDTGLLQQETVTTIAQRMALSLREHFPEMTGQAIEHYLKLLQRQCSETADKVIRMAGDTHWLDWKKNMKSKGESKPTDDGYLLFWLHLPFCGCNIVSGIL